MQWWDWDIFFGEWEPTIRGWLIALGGGIALFFGTRTYLMNARTKREAQARLVYGTLVSAGSKRSLGFGEVALEPGIELADGIRENAANEVVNVLVYKVRNASDELVGPLALHFFYIRDEEVVRLVGRVEALEPESEHFFTFAVRAVPGPKPKDYFTLRFRDSSGKWWQRHGMHPIAYVGRPGMVAEYPVDMRH